jgi:hypothetical protein
MLGASYCEVKMPIGVVMFSKRPRQLAKFRFH